MATLEQLSAALVKADAAGNTADAKVFADEIRKMRSESPDDSGVLQGAKNLAAGAVRGAGSIGATILAPYDMAVDAIKGDRGKTVESLISGKELPSRNQERRAQMDAGLQSLVGAEPESWMYKGGKLAGEIAGTAGAGGALANVATKVPGLAAAAPNFINAIRSSGMTAGPVTGIGNMAVRAAGGALSGGVSAGMVDPREAGMGAMIGGGLPVAVKAAGTVAGGLGDLVRYVKKPPETRIANKLAQALGMTPDELAQKVTLAGPQMLPGYQATVPQILQDPVTSQLQRTLKTAGSNALGDAERAQQAQMRAALERVAPIDLSVQDAAQRAGSSIQAYAAPAREQASQRVRNAFDAVDPFDESALHLPIDEMKAASAKYLGPGTFGTGGKASQAISTAKEVGTQELPAIKAIPQSAGQAQSLEQAVRSQGGIRPGDYLGKEISELGRKQSKTTGLVSQNGRDIESMATAMHERGFIPDNDPATLLDMLRNGAGRGVYAADHVEAGFQRMADEAAGELPKAERVSKAVPFQTVQNLRSSIGEAAEQASTKGANKEAAALRQMVSEIDSRINRAAGGGVGEGEFFPQEMADTYREALKLHADKMKKFETGPQVGLFRKGQDGQMATQGAEIPGKFYSGRRSQVDDVASLRRLIGDQPALMDEMKRYAVTEGAGTANNAEELTSKFSKWLQSRSGANAALFTPQENATLKEVGKAVNRSIRAENLGRVVGSDTAQKLEALNNLGILDSKMVNVLATRIPGISSFTTAGLGMLKESASRQRNNALSKLLASPDDLVQALKPGTAQSNKLIEYLNQSGAIGAKVAPAIAAQ